MSKSCRGCGSPGLVDGLDFGPQPISHHFTSQPNSVLRYPLAVGQCSHCSLIQLTSGPDADQLLPRIDWIHYNEPERHLDQVADQLAQLLDKDAAVLGATW